MSVEIIQARLESYQTKSKEDELNAIKEIVQEIILCALARTDFFKSAAFMGGTALRILHKLPRFSEDLDFSLLSPNENFRWKPLLERLDLECKSYNLTLESKDRSEGNEAVKRAFLKETSFGKILQLSYGRNPSDAQKIVIKLEIDTNPPPYANCTSSLVRFPFPFSVLAHDLPSLCAGKCLALLCRDYDKGRDWFDLLWYIANNIRPNLKMLSAGLNQHGPWKNQELNVTENILEQMLHDKVDKINWNTAGLEVRPFLSNTYVTDVKNWNSDYFHNNVDIFLK